MAIAKAKSNLNQTDDESHTACIGGISLNDISRYLPPETKLSGGSIDELETQLNNTARELASFYYGKAVDDSCRLSSLSEDLERDVSSMKDKEEDLCSKLENVLQLYAENSTLHNHLESNIQKAFQSIPPVISAKNSASHDLLAATIEASLLKLSLVRARLRSSLYDYSPMSAAEATVLDAVRVMDKKLKHKRRKLEAEEQDMKKRLKEYEDLLKYVDPQGGGFTQVVEDLARVNRETEECRKDLRRLGWTSPV
ncbi:hypothetical protein M422DRAFT_23853, partial [Sphaerobolus stellatus SS14]